MIGPAGSGKQAFINLLVGLWPGEARQFLLDFEVEEPAQLKLIGALAEQAASGGLHLTEILILRHIHSLGSPEVGRLARILSSPWVGHESSSFTPAPVVYATARNGAPRSDVSVALENLFPWQIRLPGLPASPQLLQALIRPLLAQFRHLHGKPIMNIDDEGLLLLTRRRWQAHFLELRSVLERAFLFEQSPVLTAPSILSAVGQERKSGSAPIADERLRRSMARPAGGDALARIQP